VKERTVSGPFAPVLSFEDGGPSPPKQTRQQQQFDFLEKRQTQFKQAAVAAKRAGNLQLAKKYLLTAKVITTFTQTSPLKFLLVGK